MYGKTKFFLNTVFMLTKLTTSYYIFQPILVENLIVVDISPVGQSPNMLGLLNIFRAIRDLDIDPFVSVAEARKEAAVQLKETIKVRNKFYSTVKPLLTLAVPDAFGHNLL